MVLVSLPIGNNFRWVCFDFPKTAWLNFNTFRPPLPRSGFCDYNFAMHKLKFHIGFVYMFFTFEQDETFKKFGWLIITNRGGSTTNKLVAVAGQSQVQWMKTKINYEISLTMTSLGDDRDDLIGCNLCNKKERNGNSLGVSKL